MVLTGHLAEEAEQVLGDINEHVDAKRNLVVAAHEFTVKLTALDNVLTHLFFEHQEHDEFFNLISELTDLFVELREMLEEIEDVELHIIAQEQAEAKQKPAWLVSHRLEIGKESAVEKRLLKKAHNTFAKAKRQIHKAEHLFEIEEGRLMEVRTHIPDDDKIMYIMKRLLIFITAYEKMFKTALV
jgi:hypothetical protein